jgi:Helix-turn-helix domain of resolvase
VPTLTAADLLILGCAWLRVTIDGEDVDAVARWAKKLMIAPQPSEALTELRRSGMSIRQLAKQTGMSKSTIARKLSQKAA